MWEADLNHAGEGNPGVVAMMHPLFPFSSGHPLSEKRVQGLSPVALAYIGDSVYELYIRTQYLFPPSRIRDYHQRVVACVRAETQAAFAKALLPNLTPVELQVFKQGRNAATGHPKRLNPDVYRQATALETLVGYLYLTDIDRLYEVLGHFSSDAFIQAGTIQEGTIHA